MGSCKQRCVSHLLVPDITMYSFGGVQRQKHAMFAWLGAEPPLCHAVPLWMCGATGPRSLHSKWLGTVAWPSLRAPPEDSTGGIGLGALGWILHTHGHSPGITAAWTEQGLQAC